MYLDPSNQAQLCKYLDKLSAHACPVAQDIQRAELVLLECRVISDRKQDSLGMLLVRIPHVLRDPNKDGSDSNKIPSLLILRNMINNLHEMLDQFLA